ncbi:DNA phosphorothioation-dependent restriction protein DptG [Haloarchaeobius sp. DYHT-AS-18]|uniref:DNA phosphorothioation-dependent restriction protein DptG n=1 Tax=Haloarchaeobius sp. DYHT-AS-18 TaxID=3446117 RepID=UPI003EBAFF4D
MSTQKSVPEFDGSVNRVIEGAFFPMSPAATLRESIFSEILAGVLGASPETDDLEDLEEEVRSLEAMDGDNAANVAWDVFEESYTTTGERGARGKKAKRYVLPFHPQIAKSIKPKETRNWGKWYRMLMSTGSPPNFNRELHEEFVERLEQMEPSNLFEQIFVDAAAALEPPEAEREEPAPIRPYVVTCAENFQSDLRTWLEDDYDSSTNWLQSTKDLFCFHFMMYYLQLSINLREEFAAVSEGPPYDYEPRMQEIYFGLWDESATHDRRFSKEWRERDDEGLERFVYDSWGRLAVLRFINDIAAEATPQGEEQRYHLSEAMRELPQSVRRDCVDEIDAFVENDSYRGLDLPSASTRLVRAVNDYYSSRSESNQTPISMGINVIRQLGEGQDRRYYRTQRSVGPTLRLNRSALRFFARLFAKSHDEHHYDQFIQYLQRRGVSLDSQSEALALEELDEMGLIDRQSDSGEAVYVRSI